MDFILEEFRTVAKEIKYSEPKIRVVVTVRGKGEETKDFASAEYWVKQLRETVRFGEGIEELLQDGYKRFLEIGPGSSFVAMAALASDKENCQWLATIKKERSDWSQVLESLSELYTRGQQIDWKGFDKEYSKRKRIQLPTYPFQRERYWIERVMGLQR